MSNPNFAELAAALQGAGLPIPAPLASALKGEFLPLALGTREAWPKWASDRGYGAEHVAALHRAVGRLVHHPLYVEAVAADLSERHDVNGVPVERVRPEDRLAAAMTLLQRASRAKPAVTSRPAPAPQSQTAAAPKRSVISLPRARERSA
jgi:hypothetical protein